MRSNRHTIITISRALLALGFGVLASNHALAQDCTAVSGSTVIITTNCSVLNIGGNGSNVTINSGVTIDSPGTGAVATGDSTNATITNNGTISVTTNRAFRTSGGLIDELINNGIITAGGIEGLRNGGTINILTNTGTISADGNRGIVNRGGGRGTIGTIINSGTISSGNNNGLETGGIIGTITNSGTISAANDFGISNTGTITTITNRGSSPLTGLIFASGNNIGIFNSGTITTLNNLQGASSSALTYDGTLPTNYNIIVNSISDFGKIVFSDVSGAINFGIDSSSTLADVDTTYSSVLSGLSSSDIASGTSGTFNTGVIRRNWTLDNSSGSLWDLNVIVINITSNTNTSVTTSVKPNVILAINSFNVVTEANFANMNTYDCDLFGKNNVCASLGGRHTTITNPRTRVDSGVLTFGYKLSDNFRVAAFRHNNFNQKTPKSFKLSDKTPLIGALVVWNENTNKLGYQLKLANAFQQKNVELTREVIGFSEEGKGQTVMEAQSYVAELQYAYQLNDDTVIHPYLAVRRALIKQDAYTETGVSLPLSFNKIEDKSIAVLLGLKLNRNLSTDIILKGSLGVEHDISHTVNRLEPTGISGLTTVNLDESFNDTRPVVSIGVEFNLAPNQRLASTLQYQELSYQSKSESNAYLYYTYGF